jgi:hypothetical protein
MRVIYGAFEWIECTDWGYGFPVTVIFKVGLN